MKIVKRSNHLFNLIAPVYGLFYKSQKKNYIEIIKNIKDEINLVEFNSVIDVGCGTGALCSALNEEGLSVTGVDPAERMLKIGSKKLENKNIRFIKAGTCKPLPFEDKSFDFSIASFVAHGIKEEERIKLYKENADFIIKRVLLFGDKKDYDILKKRYSYEEIKKAASKISYPDKKNANFWSFIFNLSNDKKCTKKLSTQKQSVFWKR